MKEALLYESLEDKKVRCHLCSHNCIIPKGKRGLCGVRENHNGTLYSLVYGKIIAENLDPIEKKPLYHFLPGSFSYSIATVGCNFKCSFCQNFEISQYPHLYPGEIPGTRVSPEKLVERALSTGCKSISFTYTEPTIFLEYALDCAKESVKKDLKNVFVSNGFMTPLALDLIKDYLHGINVDLKSFRESFYQRICKAKLKPVLENLKLLKRLGIWVEITTLLIPGENDSPPELKDIALFIREELGPDTPWHISRFYPQYQMLDKLPTSLESLERAYAIGKEVGLYFIYIGNVRGTDKENTYCPQCYTLLIERYGFRILQNRLTSEGRCPNCSFLIAGVWK